MSKSAIRGINNHKNTLVKKGNNRSKRGLVHPSSMARIPHLQRTLGNLALSRLLQAEELPSLPQRQIENEEQEEEILSAKDTVGAAPESDELELPEEEVEPLGGELRPKLEVGPADDAYEREADGVAKQVTGFERSVGVGLLRQALDSDEDQTGTSATGGLVSPVGASSIERLRISAAGDGGGIVPRSVERRIMQSRGNGRTLPAYVAQSMALHTGYDFSDVRVKNDAEAADLNGAVNARAFTLGSDIWLGGNESVNDLGLMAHELTHVVQQGSAKRVAAKRLGAKGASAVLQHLKALRSKGPEAASVYTQEIRQFQSEHPVQRIVALQRQILDGPSAAINQKSGSAVLRRCARPGGSSGPTFSSAGFNKGSGGKVTFASAGTNAKLFSSAYSSSGKVKVSGGTDAQAKDWEAGFIQTFVSRTGTGHYKGSKKYSSHAWTIPGPRRDALVQPGEPWYDPNNTNGPGRVPFKKTGLTVSTSLWDRPEDWFPWDTPDKKGKLDHSDGKSKLALWMIARQKSSPNTIHYLNWAAWEVGWSAAYDYASKGAKTTTSITGATKVTSSGAGKGKESPVLSGKIFNDSQTPKWS